MDSHPAENQPGPSSSSSRPQFPLMRIRHVWISTAIYDVRSMAAIMRESNYKYMTISCTTPCVPELRPLLAHESWTQAEINYQQLRIAVNLTDPIQIAITLALADAAGNMISDATRTFQFNLRITKNYWDNHPREDLALIFYNGFNLDKHKNEGILFSDLIHLFFEFKVFSPDLGKHVIVYEGGLDFVYLVKFLNRGHLPPLSEHFLTLLSGYMPQAYDLKFLCKFINAFSHLRHTEGGIQVDYVTSLIQLARATGVVDWENFDLTLAAPRAILIAKLAEKLKLTTAEWARWQECNHVICGLNAI